MNNEYFDNKDDRKEIFNLLLHLDERKREAFLSWACKQVPSSLNKTMRPGRDSSYHEREVFWQLMSLVYVHGLDLKKTYEKLIQYVRKNSLE